MALDTLSENPAPLTTTVNGADPSSHPAVPLIDEAAFESHFEMLNHLAAASGVDGILVLFAVGENPTTGQKVGPHVLHFKIGDTAGMMTTARGWFRHPHLNVYAPWAVFRPNLPRGSKGEEADIVAVLALVVDQDNDTGKSGALPLPAPYTIESSADNFQAVYPLSRALLLAEAKPIGEALVKAVGCDAGTKDMSHVWRVPGLLNWPRKSKLKRNRPREPQPVTIAKPWAGDLVDPAALTKAVDEALAKAANEALLFKVAAAAKKPNGAAEPDDARIFGGDFEQLRSCLAAISAERHTAYAPWLNIGMAVHHETEGSDEGLTLWLEFSARMGDAYDEGEAREKWQSFKTGHDKPVTGKTLAKLAYEEAGWVRPAARDGRPVVRIAAGQLPRMVDEAEAALKAAGVPIFVRGDSLVRPVTAEAPAARGRMTMVAKFRAFCSDSLIDEFSKAARFQKYDGRMKGWATIDPPKQVGAILLTRQGSWKVDRVAGVITTPTLRPDGSILSEQGYDPATRLYLAPDPGFCLPPIAEQPSRADAEAALALLADLLVEFPFVGPVDHAVALSGLLTAVVRGGLPTAPMHAIRAHTAGTGKSLLVDVAATIATGRPCPVSAASQTEEEMEKRLVAFLREGVPILSIDNATRPLAGDMLCQISERPSVRVRLLGLSEGPEFECRTAVFATGNNLKLKGDMTRRAVLCSLDANEERPELRRFKFDPIARVLKNRGAFVAAALTIARAYSVGGEPVDCTPIGSYGEWSKVVREPLIWLGQADPVESMETARAEDPELAAIRELFALWQVELIQNKDYTARDLVHLATSQHDTAGSPYVRPALREFLQERAGKSGEISAQRLGIWLGLIEGRPVNGFRLDVKKDPKNGNQFALRPIPPKPQSHEV
jgi:hypothetical protein